MLFSIVLLQFDHFLAPKLVPPSLKAPLTQLLIIKAGLDNDIPLTA